MGSYYVHREAPPCPNCGKPDSARMGSTEWRHNYSCCSDRCGKRLAKRIENGMFSPKNEDFFFADNTNEALRNRIRHLKNQLKRNGIKPVRS
jgi:ribosomal protein L37AE/L43A